MGIVGTKCPIPMDLEPAPTPALQPNKPFAELPLEPGYLEEVVVTGEGIDDIVAFVVDDLPEEQVRTALDEMVVVRMWLHAL